MPNEHYQSLFGRDRRRPRKRFLDGAPAGGAGLLRRIEDDALAGLVTDLGGHDIATLLEAFAAATRSTDRPSVVFAYTIKGWGLPIAGNPRNHSALLSAATDRRLRERARDRPARPSGTASTPATRAGQRAAPATRAPRAATPTERGSTCRPACRGLRVTSPRRPRMPSVGSWWSCPATRAGAVLVTTAPDVATSTNLAGFIKRTGVFSPSTTSAWGDDRPAQWTESPTGQHIELGISEMNLFLLFGQLGLRWDLSDQPLLPIGTVYDPFVLRGLDAFIYSVYSGSRFVVAGTPSGITLAPEGGAHQSTITPSVGLELPNTTLIEPAYGTALDWLLCDAVGRIATGDQTGHPDVDLSASDRGAYYFRLTTRPLDQQPFEQARSVWVKRCCGARCCPEHIDWSTPRTSPRRVRRPSTSPRPAR